MLVIVAVAAIFFCAGVIAGYVLGRPANVVARGKAEGYRAHGTPLAQPLQVDEASALTTRTQAKYIWEETQTGTVRYENPNYGH
jgi:hypothetical protein